jgi:hypothetical protein
MAKHEGLLAIDPSIRSCGIAIFDRDKLVYANVLRTSAVVNTLTGVTDILDLAQASWEQQMSPSVSPETLIVELPQIYQQAQLKGDPNDLIPLALLAGRLWERFKPKNIMLPLPKEWKAQVPKEVMTKRTLSKLDKREIEVLGNDLIRVPKGLQHNAFDAIGLGLYALNRLGKRE